jgi:tight adherence protein B
MVAFGLCVVGAVTVWLIIGKLLLSMLAGVGLGSLPFLKLRSEKNRRFNLFEEQLVAALDIMIRALRAGYPFPETLRQVSKELEDPVAAEFRLAFDQINGGIEVRTALRNMVTRVPSLSLMAVVTTVLLQRETGGNLSETLTNIGAVIRGRFKFQRHIKTLTAEGRISAWVLGMIPFVIFIIQLFMSPDLVLNFIKDPDGQEMIMIGCGFIAAGVVWIRKLLDLQI